MILSATVVNEHWNTNRYVAVTRFFFFNRSLVRSVSVDNELDQLGQTSRSLVGAEIQIRCNFAESLLDNYWLLRFVHCLFYNQALF